MHHCEPAFEHASNFFTVHRSAPKYAYSDPQHAPLPQPVSGPSPQYGPLPPSDAGSQENEYYIPETYVPPEAQQQMSESQTPTSQPRGQSPARRSLFDFVSAFDALASSPSSVTAKRKPVPAEQASSNGNPEDPWVGPPVDPKRKSVENLMDQLTRGQMPPPAPVQAAPAPYDTYASPEDVYQAEPVQQSRAPRPLPPQPPRPTSSPRGSPPKSYGQPRQPRRGGDSPIGPPAPQGSFGPTVATRAVGSTGRTRGPGPKGNTRSVFECVWRFCY